MSGMFDSQSRGSNSFRKGSPLLSEKNQEQPDDLLLMDSENPRMPRADMQQTQPAEYYDETLLEKLMRLLMINEKRGQR